MPPKSLQPWLALATGAVMMSASPAFAALQSPDGGAPVDIDVDGLSDELERTTGTSPLKQDSDGDGVPDGVEDRDRDGVVDDGESDPRRSGLFPGSAPHIPEPMNFDLVRGLGARRGEIEANVLVQVRPRAGAFGPTTWAPEIEWAILDNLAVELELPFTDRELEALKAAAQWTAPSPLKGFTHGAQLIGEYVLDALEGQVTGLYLAGGRLGRVSLFSMLGPRVIVGPAPDVQALVNPSVFVDVDEAVTLGLETNLAWSPRAGFGALSLLQVHWQIARRLRVQVGGGVDLRGGQVGALVVSRFILE